MTLIVASSIQFTTFPVIQQLKFDSEKYFELTAISIQFSYFHIPQMRANSAVTHLYFCMPPHRVCMCDVFDFWKHNWYAVQTPLKCECVTNDAYFVCVYTFRHRHKQYERYLVFKCKALRSRAH